MNAPCLLALAHFATRGPFAQSRHPVAPLLAPVKVAYARLGVQVHQGEAVATTGQPGGREDGQRAFCHAGLFVHESDDHLLPPLIRV